MNMHMVFADHTFENPHIFGIADLHDQISAPHFNFTLQHVVAVLRDPDDVRRESRNAVAVMAILLHSHTSTIGWDE